MPTFWRVLVVNSWWILSKGIFCIYWDDHMIFIFQFVNMVCHIDWFPYIENPCIPGINPIWSWCMSNLMCCCILFAKILLRIFASMLISDIGLWFSFLGWLCLVLVSGWRWPCRVRFEVFLPLQIFERISEG